MTIKTLQVGPIMTICYLLCDEDAKVCALIDPGDDFGCKGYVRIAYCVSPDMIARALPAFEKLAKEYSL